MADVNLATTETLKIGATEGVAALAKSTSTTLVEYLVANETIFPSGYDIAAVVGDGITMRERSLSDNWIGLLGNNFTVSGLLIPASSLTLSLTMPTGVAYIAGRTITLPATVLTFSPSTTSYVFLKVTRDASLNVTGAWYEVNTTGTPPLDATPIGTATTSVGAITGTTSTRVFGPYSTLHIESGTSWIVPAGIGRAFVEVFGASGGGGGGGGSSGAVAGPTFDAGSAGSAGGNGGSTTFDGTLSCTGGQGGTGGLAGSSGAGTGNAVATHGAGSGGVINKTGTNQPGGRGGSGGRAPINLTVGQVNGGAGQSGGNGGYCAYWVTLTAGTAITIAIGAAGSSGGAGGAGSGGGAGSAGGAGRAGRIVVHY